MVESCPDSKSDGDSLTSDDSEIGDSRLVTSFLTVFGSFPTYFLYGDLPFLVGYMRRANRISDRPEWSLSSMICLFVRSLSFIMKRFAQNVLNRLLQKIVAGSVLMLFGMNAFCLMKRFAQNVLNRLLQKIVAGSVLMLFGMPCLAMYFLRNSITFSVVGFLKNLASGHPDK